MKIDELKLWLQSQLTSTKASETSWLDLASALAQGIHDHVEGLLDRIKSRNSLYDMEKQDLLLDTKELRTIFPIADTVSDEDLPHVIMRRQDEIHFKKTVYPLVATISREFAGMNISWEPLYAPVDQVAYPYGDLFVTQHEMENYLQQGLSKDDFFMTSRGVIRVPINNVAGGVNGITEDDIAVFEARVRRVIYPLIPLRIVCDGQSYFISVSMSEIVDVIQPLRSHITDNYFQATDESEIKPVIKLDVVQSVVMTDETKASRLYGTPRMDSVRCDAISLDRRYY